MSWLVHKFATALQSGLFVVGTAIAGGALVGGTTYDSWIEDADNITGANRDAIVQAFNGEIDKLEDIQGSFENLKSEYNLKVVKGQAPDSQTLQNNIKKNEIDFNILSSHIEQEMHLSKYISEQDFINLGTKYNDLFPLGKHSIDLSGAAYLHDAQVKYDTTLSQSDRNILANNIKSDMRKFIKIENKVDRKEDALEVTAIGIGTLTSLVFGLALVMTADLSEAFKKLAKEPAPRSPLYRLSKGVKRYKLKKQKKINRIN